MNATSALPVILMSIYKPILMTIVVLGWAKWATILDKDAEYYYLPRRMLNLVQLGAGLVGIALWLLIPYFWVGLLLAVMVMVGAGAVYWQVRNRNVPESQRWTLNADFLNSVILKRRQAAAAKQAVLRFVAHRSRSSSDYKPVPLQEDDNYKSHLGLEEIFTAALSRRAQQLQITISGREATAQIVVDGVNYSIEAAPAGEVLAMVDYLKGEAGMDVSDRRRKLTGQTRVDMGDLGQHDVLMSTAGSTRGITAIIDFDPKGQLDIPLKESGLLEAQLQQLQPVFESQQGVVLVASPPRNGRTATLYAMLQQHDPYMLDIHTLEKAPEIEIEGVTQHTPGAEGMAKTLQSMLLRDPTVVMVAQLADQTMPTIIAKAGLDDKRLYVGIRGDDTFVTVKSWAKAVGDLKLTANSLTAVICQRLIRKLCPTCRQAYQPDAAALKKLNLPADRIQQLYKASGKVMDGNKEQPCPTCAGLGYFGRTGAYEVLVLDDEARRLLAAGNMDQLRNHARRNRMLLLQEAALAKVVSGETSISEVMRVMAGKG
jgi:type IV pilus assembly protein PilB